MKGFEKNRMGLSPQAGRFGLENSTRSRKRIEMGL